MSYRFADSLRAVSGRNKLSANLYDIYHCCVYSEETPDDGQRNCPKHVVFYSKNKFEKLVHLVGFIIRIYHDARSTERQIYPLPTCITNTTFLKLVLLRFSGKPTGAVLLNDPTIN